MRKDLSAILPDGSTFEFWEKDPEWTRELFVSNTDPAASDGNDGSEEKPFRNARCIIRKGIIITSGKAPTRKVS